MDTTKLVVGQKIWMQSGPLLKEATVTEITEEYIEVKPVAFDQNERPWMIHFQKDGKQFSVEDLVKRTGGYVDWKYLGNLGVYDWTCRGWERHDPRPEGGPAGPWELTLRGDGTALVN
jgi:hypothetical protein